MMAKHRHLTPERCQGYGSLFVNRHIADLLRTTLEHSKYHTSERRLGSTVMIKYGSEKCLACNEWLRR